MLPTIVSSYGIHNGRKSATDAVLRRMEALDYPTKDPELAYRWALTAWFFVRRDAREVRDVLRDGDVMVCHSYGCLRGTLGARMAYKQGTRVKVLFLIAPAMSKDFRFDMLPPDITVVCLYSKDDVAVKWGARWPFHAFGSAGNVGFTDERVININFDGRDHGDYFNEPDLSTCVDMLHSLLSTYPLVDARQLARRAF